MVYNKEYIIVKANVLYRLNPLAPHILRFVLSTTEIIFILFFIYKIRQSHHLTKKFIKKCKVNKPIYPFLSANKVIFLLLFTLKLPLIISAILYLFNNGQDNFL